MGTRACGRRKNEVKKNLCRLNRVAAFMALFALPLLQTDICSAGAAAEQLALQEPLPVSAEELLPLKSTHGVYLVKEGPEKGREVPFSLEQLGNRWILTKEGLTRHELQRDAHGNILILKETNLLENRQVEYNPPIVLLPAVVNGNTSLAGKTRVTIKNAKTGAVTYRGECTWQLIFAGIESTETSSGTFSTYHFQVKHQIALPLAHASLTIDFGYAIGKGIVVTAVDQVTRVFGLFSNRITWRLEQKLAPVKPHPPRMADDGFVRLKTRDN